MDFRDNIPLNFGMLFFMVFFFSMMIVGFFSTIKKTLYFSFSTLLFWFIGLGIAYASAGFTADWVAGLIDPKLFAPAVVTRLEIANIIQPYSMLVVQYLFILIAGIPQIIIWNFVINRKVKPTRSKTKNGKKRKQKIEFNLNLTSRLATMTIVPLLAMPQIVQFTHLSMAYTLSKTKVEENPKSANSGFAYFIESFDRGLGSPTANVWDDAESFLALGRMSTNSYGGKPVLEWYSDFFSDLFNKIDFNDDVKSIESAHEMLLNWKEINATYAADLENLFRSETISVIFLRTLKESITVDNIHDLSKNFKKLTQLSNGLINGFSLVDNGEVIAKKPLGDFAVPVNFNVFSLLKVTLQDCLFNEEYSADKTIRENDCNQFVNYFFYNKDQGKFEATGIRIDTIVDVKTELPDVIGSGIKDDPYQVKVDYFSQPDIKSFFYQLIPFVTPVTADQKIGWSFVTTMPSGVINFSDNNWIVAPDTNNYWGNIYLNYDKEPIVETPAGEVWGITSTATAKDSGVKATHEFFWKYIK